MKTVRQRNILKCLYEAYDILTCEQQDFANRADERLHWQNVTTHIACLAEILQDIENQDYPYKEIA